MTRVFELYRSRHVPVRGGLGFLGSNPARRILDHGGDVPFADTLRRPTGRGRRVSLRDDLTGTVRFSREHLAQDMVVPVAEPHERTR